jgi:hypothetical protein
MDNANKHRYFLQLERGKQNFHPVWIYSRQILIAIVKLFSNAKNTAEKLSRRKPRFGLSRVDLLSGDAKISS